MAEMKFETFKFEELDEQAKNEALECCGWLLDEVRLYNQKLVTEDLQKRKMELAKRVEEAQNEINKLNSTIKCLNSMVDNVFNCQCDLGYVIEDITKENEGIFLFNKFGEPFWTLSQIKFVKLRNLF